MESNRLRGWNYARDGAYFLTLVTKNREPYFGHVENGTMMLNDFGQIAHREWLRSFEIRDELFPGEFIVMPNHIHGIVVVDRANHPAETHGRASLQGGGVHSNLRVGGTDIIRQPKSISSFVAGYKSAVVNKIDDFIDDHQLQINKFNRRNPLWQKNYYDHIMRNQKALQRIENYIRKNPMKWQEKLSA